MEIKQNQNPTKRFMIAIPVTGLVRIEWVWGRYHQIIPCNWSQVETTSFISTEAPYRHLVADARNILVQRCLEKEFEWLFFVDHDVILPPATILRWNERMMRGDVPVWCGLYFAKGNPSEPLIFRGRGNSFYNKWKMGDEVWCDGIPMGCTMIHSSILRAIYDESEEYQMQPGVKLKRVFETPRKAWYDPEMETYNTSGGTEDLHWCTRVMQQNIFKKAGWPKFQKKKYPFLVDTNIFCRHIDWNGIQFPRQGEELAYAKKNPSKNKG